MGKLAIYWNENGLNAFIEHNKTLEASFAAIDVALAQSYVPFHFCQALLARNGSNLLSCRKILVVSSLCDREQAELTVSLLKLGCSDVQFYKCSATKALVENYGNIAPNYFPSLVLVAAGIGAAKALIELSYLNCPILDIGSYIHVLSGRAIHCHAGFFYPPTV